jgi:hypothetical protein
MVSFYPEAFNGELMAGSNGTALKTIDFGTWA